MKSGFIIITNNELVQERLGSEYDVDYEKLSYEDTLKKVRDMIYQGHRLLTHPLSGSVKPNETPYKSVLLTSKVTKLDVDSAEIIENAIHACSKFQFRCDKYHEDAYEDFRLVDYSLISGAIPSAAFLQ